MKTIKNSFTVLASALVLLFTVLGADYSTANSSQSWTLNQLDSCPTAGFSVVNNGSTAGTAIQFVNQSSGATSYHWDFGDGTFSCAENPVHVYNAPGVYTVKLKAIVDGCMVEFIGTEDIIAN